jgi:hypothetical protein
MQAQAPDLQGAFRFAPDMADATLKTANAIYAARAFQHGLKGEDALSRDGEKLYSRAVQEAAGAAFTADGTQYGGIVDFQGRKVQVPASIKANDFAPIVKGLTADQIVKGSAYGGAPTRADGTPLTSMRNAYLISVGDGRYAVSVTDPQKGDPQLLRDPKAPVQTNHAYILDLHRVLPWMQGGKR